MNEDLISDIFRPKYRELSEEEKARVDHLKVIAGELYVLLCPGSPEDKLALTREMSLAKTKLEECVMWAVKSLTGPLSSPSKTST